MRILMTTDTVGGVWTFTTELTQQLLQRGHAVHLISFGRWTSADQHSWLTRTYAAFSDIAAGKSPETARFTFTSTDIPLEWMEGNERAFEEGQTVLLSELQERPADLILANQFCFGRLDTSVPRVVVAHSDVLSWALACREAALEPGPWLNRYTSMVQAGLLDAVAVVTPTAWMGRALTSNFNLPRTYVVVPNGTTAIFPPVFADARQFQAITAGRLWDEAKGLGALRHLNSPMPILVAGDNTFEFAATETTWPAHLTNLGPLARRDLHRHFRQSAMYLCTSLYEPFGLAPLEAALCGCALVARDLPSLREVWADSALYFDDTVSLTGILNTLANHPDLLSQAQIRTHQRALQFTPERMAESYLQLFETVLNQPPSSQHVA